MPALLIKESVNQTVDAMGFLTALDGCFKIHQLNHAHWVKSPAKSCPTEPSSTGSATGAPRREILPAAKRRP
jgi:enoyl-CoA hydratase